MKSARRSANLPGMATWAIGDLHGCFDSLEQLLERIDLDRERDTLWLVGDLVNRGPRSLATLRWARDTAEAMGERFVAVLGNHDLHFLARWAGLADPKAKDTLDELLADPAVDELAEWLARRPFLHRDGDRLLVHAGLLPQWSLDEATRWAGRLAERMSDASARRQLLDPPSTELVKPRPDLDEASGLRLALDTFVKLRCCSADGVLCRFTGPPLEAPPGCIPWFAVPRRRHAQATVVFGHWAAMGLRVEPRLLALDSACVWGRQMTAIRLEDRYIVQVEAVESRSELPG